MLMRKRIDPQMQPIVDGLLDILDILDKPGVWRAHCTCGWDSEEFEHEEDSVLARWAHAPCYLPRIRD